MKRLAFLIVFAASPCAAQQNAATTLAQNFRDCSYRAGLQLIVEKNVWNASAAAEAAFQACATEEQATYLALYGAGIDPAIASGIVTRVKLGVKATLRKIVSENQK